MNFSDLMLKMIPEEVLKSSKGLEMKEFAKEEKRSG